MSNRALVYRYLKDKHGFSDEGIAAIMGNLQHESSFEPRKLEGGALGNRPTVGQGFGIAQWTDAARQNRLARYAREQGTDITDLETQVDFMVQELQNYKGLYRRLQRGTERGRALQPEALASEFETAFLRPEPGSQQSRARFTSEIFNSIGSRRNLTEEERIGESQQPRMARAGGGRLAAGVGGTPDITQPGTAMPTEEGQNVLGQEGEYLDLIQAARSTPALTNPRTGAALTPEQARKRLQRARKKTQGDPDALAPAEIDILARDYGFAWALISSNDEWFDIFTQSVLEGATPDRFMARIRGTNTYRETTEAYLDSEILRTSRPAEYNAILGRWKEWLTNKSTELGVPVDEEWLNTNAKYITQGAVKPWQVDKVFGEALTVSENPDLLGRAGNIQDSIRKLALNNGLNVSVKEINNYVSQILRNQITENDAYDAIRRMAANNYQKYSDRILAGVDLKDLASPYTRAMSEILEIAPDSIKFDDPLLTDALTGDVTLTDFRQRLRSDPRWQYTQNAQDETLGALSSVLKDFGLF